MESLLVLNKCLLYISALIAGTDEKIREMNSQKLSESPRTLSSIARQEGAE
jgi:hypothetical protein